MGWKTIAEELEEDDVVKSEKDGVSVEFAEVVAEADAVVISVVILDRVVTVVLKWDLCVVELPDVDVEVEVVEMEVYREVEIGVAVGLDDPVLTPYTATTILSLPSSSAPRALFSAASLLTASA